MNINLRPLQDRVVVQHVTEEVTKGGIVIPDTAKEKPQKGKVVAVGPGKTSEDGKTRPINVKIGDTVLYGKYAGTEVKLNGQDLIVMREDDIMGVIEN